MYCVIMKYLNSVLNLFGMYKMRGHRIVPVASAIKRLCRKKSKSGMVGLIATAAEVSYSGREEFICGEFDVTEHFTGVVRRGYTFFLGHTEIIGRNQHLHIANNLHDGEKADGHKYAATPRRFEAAAITFADAFRDTTAALAGRRRITQAGRKADGTGYLYAGFRQNLPAGGILFCWRIIRVEHFYISFASIKDYLFIEDGNAAYDYAARVGRAEYV